MGHQAGREACHRSRPADRRRSCPSASATCSVHPAAWSDLPAQLERGEPITITHPEMTRYFMTIPEAVWLIFDSAAIGDSGSLIALDMGQPVRIVDLAHDLIRLSGRDPDSVPIEFTGLRPGEKLHEELFYASEHAKPTQSAQVMLAAPHRIADGLMDDVAQCSPSPTVPTIWRFAMHCSM